MLWLLVLRSGVHATLAGVALALTVPLVTETPGLQQEEPPLLRLEHAIQPAVAFGIVPLFGFAKAGVSFAGFSMGALVDRVPLGVAAGLFLGKQVGVFGSAWLAIRLRIAFLPERATWTQLCGIALLCGIGFTMSLFVGLLAFPTLASSSDRSSRPWRAPSFCPGRRPPPGGRTRGLEHFQAKRVRFAVGSCGKSKSLEPFR